MQRLSTKLALHRLVAEQGVRLRVTGACGQLLLEHPSAGAAATGSRQVTGNTHSPHGPTADLVVDPNVSLIAQADNDAPPETNCTPHHLADTAFRQRALSGARPQQAGSTSDINFLREASISWALGAHWHARHQVPPSLQDRDAAHHIANNCPCDGKCIAKATRFECL